MLIKYFVKKTGLFKVGKIMSFLNYTKSKTKYLKYKCKYLIIELHY